MKKEKNTITNIGKWKKGKRLNLAAAILCGAMIKPGNCNSEPSSKTKTPAKMCFKSNSFLIREALFSSEEAPSYLRGTVDLVGRNDWSER
ncbi:hypothetical protein P7H20_20455 [Paenibacillus larvae]|nr:hypothetical protein [Paenibacillus larvae]MDT2276722.1 hypothetical protein [Paenibacillus larvae]